MPRLTEISRLVNSMWINCLNKAGIKLPGNCPTDKEVAKAIKEHLKRKRKQKQENEHDEA